MRRYVGLGLLGCLWLSGCQRSEAIPGGLTSLVDVAGNPATSSTGFQFVDATAESGVEFRHFHGGTGKHFYIEVMGPGCAFLDYDQDGHLDLFLVQGGRLSDDAASPRVTHCLYRNLGQGRFVDVTHEAGLDWEHYGVGCCAGDYDNDGDQDLVVTGLATNVLLENLGDGSFRRASKDVLPAGASMSTSPVFLDYDHDGNLDLFICRYSDYNIGTNPLCSDEEGRPAYCTPNAYEATVSVLYRNTGAGTFVDVSESTGIRSASGRAMGLAVADYNDDGKLDLYVSSDMTRNLLFMSQDESGFDEIGTVSGVAYGATGIAHAGMGVDCGDFDNDGLMDLVVTNFEGEPNTLFQNQGGGLFIEKSRRVGLARPSHRWLSWGVRFEDFDLDGWQDLFVASGHVNDYDEAHSQPCQIYRNEQGEYVDRSDISGPFFALTQVARGAAFGDYDNDGDIDVAVSANNQPARLAKNESVRNGNYVQLQLIGDGCNRDALGCRVRVLTDTPQTKFVRSGGSYLSDHDRRLIYGIGSRESVTVEIRWPCGCEQSVEAVANQLTVIHESECQLQRGEP